MLDELGAGHRMLALGEPRELRFLDVTRQAPSFGQASVPFAANLVALGVVVRAGVGELLGVIQPDLTGTERLRDGEHGGLRATSRNATHMAVRRRSSAESWAETAALASATLAGSGGRSVRWRGGLRARAEGAS